MSQLPQLKVTRAAYLCNMVQHIQLQVDEEDEITVVERTTADGSVNSVELTLTGCEYGMCLRYRQCYSQGQGRGQGQDPQGRGQSLDSRGQDQDQGLDPSRPRPRPRPGPSRPRLRP